MFVYSNALTVLSVLMIISSSCIKLIHSQDFKSESNVETNNFEVNLNDFSENLQSDPDHDLWKGETSSHSYIKSNERVDIEGITSSINNLMKHVKALEHGTPTNRPTSIPTSVPTSIPSSVPTSMPTAYPTTINDIQPTSSPTSVPSAIPTSIPTAIPTSIPTSRPTSIPTSRPTSIPTSRPTSIPTSRPTSIPTSRPTSRPTAIPSSKPTSAPIVFQPTESPTTLPTTLPTVSPTSTPTFPAPTFFPTRKGSSAPSFRPSLGPGETYSPTVSFEPTSAPTLTPPVIVIAANQDMSGTTVSDFTTDANTAAAFCNSILNLVVNDDIRNAGCDISDVTPQAAGAGIHLLDGIVITYNLALTISDSASAIDPAALAESTKNGLVASIAAGAFNAQWLNQLSSLGVTIPSLLAAQSFSVSATATVVITTSKPTPSPSSRPTTKPTPTPSVTITTTSAPTVQVANGINSNNDDIDLSSGGFLALWIILSVLVVSAVGVMAYLYYKRTSDSKILAGNGLEAEEIVFKEKDHGGKDLEKGANNNEQGIPIHPSHLVPVKPSTPREFDLSDPIDSTAQPRKGSNPNNNTSSSTTNQLHSTALSQISPHNVGVDLATGMPIDDPKSLQSGTSFKLYNTYEKK